MRNKRLFSFEFEEKVTLSSGSAYSEPCQTSKMELFTKIANG